MNFGERIRRIRQEKRKSQRQVAELMGVSQQAIAKYEKLADTPKKTTCVKLAQALDVGLYEIFY